MILVTGATGKTGSRVLDQLCGAGIPARALVRTPQKAVSVPSGVEVVIGCYEDAVSLDAAVSGCSAVFLVSAAGPEQRRQEGAVVDAVRRAGTEARIVKIASMGLDDPHAGRIDVQHGQIRDDLAASGLPWTVLAVSQLYDNLFLYAEPVLGQGILPIAAGAGRIPWVDADDVAAVAVAALTEPGHGGRTYDVTGPESLHADQVAELLGRAVGREVRYVAIPEAVGVAAITAAGVPAWVAAGVVEANHYFEVHQVAASRVVEQLTGRMPKSMAEFLAESAPIWQAMSAGHAAQGRVAG